MPTLRIRLFGSPSVQLDDHLLSHEMNTKAQALLYYLVTTGRTHYRNELASLFWPDMPDVQALKNLRNILPVLRSAVGSHLVITRQTVSFNHYTPHWIDVKAFVNLMGIDPTQASTTALAEAVALYEDDFLNGFYVRNAPLFEEWMLLERERLRGQLTDALQSLATRSLHHDDYQAALHVTRRLLNIEPWREAAHRQQMQALVGLGQRVAALAQYDLCCHILGTEFDIVPGDETTRLYEQIKRDNVDLPYVDSQHSAPQTDDTEQAAADDLQYTPASLNESNGSRLPMALSPQGQVMAVPGDSTTIRLKSLETRQLLYVLAGHTGDITGLCFNPDGTLLASASADQTIRLWEVATGALHTTLTSRGGEVTAIAFSVTGKVLASASADQTIHLWDVANRRLLTTLHEHHHPVVQLVFSVDGTSLVSVDCKRVVLFWNFVEEHILRADVAPHQPRNQLPGGHRLRIRPVAVY